MYGKTRIHARVHMFLDIDLLHSVNIAKIQRVKHTENNYFNSYSSNNQIYIIEVILENFYIIIPNIMEIIR